ncbi:MAG: DMT family transporter [Sulfurovum sp.]|nr:DMT family transporter [Sulfurovum sp.]
MRLKSYQADGILLLVAISWGVTFALVQDALESVSVYTFLFWRFLFAFILMALIAWKHWHNLTKPVLYASMVLGLLNFSAFAFQTYGLTLTLSSTVAFITGLNVIFIPFLALVIFKRSVSIYAMIGAAIAIIGLWLLTGQRGLGLGLGETYTLVCAVLFSLHILFTDRFARKYTVILLVTIQFGVIALASLMVGIAQDGSVVPDSYDYAFLLAMVATVLFATIFAFWAQTSMQRFTTPAKTALIFTMEPLSAAIFGYFYAGEMLGTMQIFGGILIVAAVIFAESMTLKSKNNTAPVTK